MPLEASKAVFRSLSSQKESKLSKTLFVSRAMRCLLFLRATYSFRTFEKVSVHPSSFTFRFLSSPLLLLFFPRFFSFVGHFLGFLSVGKGFAKRDKIFTGIFWSKLHGFLRFSLACLTESRSFGYALKELVFLHQFLVKVV